VIIRKSPAEIEKIAASGAILVRTLRLLERQIRPGVTTADLDAAAERYIRSQGAVPTFKGYRGFPASICASPNSMVVHGIPGPYALERGDLISLDVGVTLDGWVADAARTFPVGAVGVLAQKLLDGTERSLFAAVEQCVVGNRLGDVSHAIQMSAEADGLAIVRTLVGHGVGRKMHEDPQIPNFGAGDRAAAAGGNGAGDRADDNRGRPGRARRHRRLGDLFAGRIARGAFRVHGRDHRGGTPRDDPVAPSRQRTARTW
jgi:methionyl aminopeptidase